MRLSYIIVGFLIFDCLLVGFGYMTLKQKEQESRVQAQCDFLAARQYASEDNTNMALAYLARSLRSDPENIGASNDAFNLLKSVPIPRATFARPQGCNIISGLFAPSDSTAQVICASGRTFWILDLPTGRAVSPIIAFYPITPTLAVFSPDGKRIAVAGEHYYQIYDTKTGAKLSKIDYFVTAGKVTEMRFSSDEKLAVASDIDDEHLVGEVYDLKHFRRYPFTIKAFFSSDLNDQAYEFPEHHLLGFGSPDNPNLVLEFQRRGPNGDLILIVYNYITGSKRELKVDWDSDNDNFVLNDTSTLLVRLDGAHTGADGGYYRGDGGVVIISDADAESDGQPFKLRHFDSLDFKLSDDMENQIGRESSDIDNTKNGATEELEKAHFDTTGRVFATLSETNKIQIWSSSGLSVSRLLQATGKIDDFALSPSGTTLFLLTSARVEEWNIKQWDMKLGTGGSDWSVTASDSGSSTHPKSIDTDETSNNGTGGSTQKLNGQSILTENNQFIVCSVPTYGASSHDDTKDDASGADEDSESTRSFQISDRSTKRAITPPLVGCSHNYYIGGDSFLNGRRLFLHCPPIGNDFSTEFSIWDVKTGCLLKNGEFGDNDVELSVSPNGMDLIIDGARGKELIDLPPTSPVPVWFPGLLETIGGAKVDKNGFVESKDRFLLKSVIPVHVINSPNEPWGEFVHLLMDKTP